MDSVQPLAAPADDDDGAARVQRKGNKLFTVCIFILVVEMCERLCYYTLTGSQRNFLEDATVNGKRGLQASAAVSISACFSMLSYLTCILGGYLADNQLGRYMTILIFSLVYVAGVALVAVSAYPSVMSSDVCLPLYLFGTLVLVALGTGAIKPNVMNFGAAQYDATDEIEFRQQKSFFSYFYLTINIGCVGAFGFCVNLATSDATPTSAGTGYFKAYLIAASGMSLAFLSFVAGTPKYTGRGGVTHTPMISIIRRYIVNGAKTNIQGKLALFGWILIPVYMAVVLVGSLLTSQPALSHILTWVAMGLAVASCALLVAVHIHNHFIQELPERIQGAVAVHIHNHFIRELPERIQGAVAQDAITMDEVKAALACVPTILCISVGFGIPYNAMNNAYPVQACQMDTRFFGGAQLNGAFFTLGDAFAIIILVPLFEKVVYPFAERLRGGRPLTRWFKWTVGFTLAVIANLSAVIIEYIRRGMSDGPDPHFVPCPADLYNTTGSCTVCYELDCKSYLLSKCSPSASLPMTAMSAFWTFIPMFLTGAGEILVNPVIYQFVFERAPARLRSIVQALNLVASGAIANAITASLSPLIPENLNKGNIVYYFYANMAFGALMLAAYWLVAALAPPAPVPASWNSSIHASSIGAQTSSVRASFLTSVDRGASVLAAHEQILNEPRRQISFSPEPGERHS